MNLDTGIKRGFVISGNSRELARMSLLPGAVSRRSEGVVRMPENLASWRALRDLEFEDISESAMDSLESLRSSHMTNRKRIRNAARRFKFTGETDIPVPLKTLPFDHQTRAYGFSSSLDQAALFMDMGTGKTLVALAISGHHYQKRAGLKVLVICPKSVKPVWPRELAKHAGYPYSVNIDAPPSGEGALFWVTNYDRIKREQGRINKWKPDLIILDESHRIKNRKAARTKSVCALKSPLRLILTGTPMGKCISEVWAQFNFLNKDIFGSFSQFKNRYLKMGGYMNYSVVGYQNEDEFADKLHSVSIRVTKEECLDLPPLTYQRLYVESDSKTRKAYSDMDLNFYTEVEGEEVSVDREATKQMKLRQIVGGMVRTDGQEVVHVSGLKASTLEEILEDRAGDKTVVFFSFSHEIALAEAICKKLKMGFRTLQGSTKDSDRETFEQDFQENPNIKVALIQVQTGAEGMTLTAADVAIFYSPTFSFFGFTQARDRVNRIGQARPVTIILIIMQETVDERVVEVLESNRQLTDTYMETKRNYTMSKKEVTGYTAAMMAAALEITPADLRKHLRALKIEKPEEGWVWKNEKAAASISKQVAARIKELEAKPAREPKAKDAPAEKPAKRKAKAEDEDSEEAPKPRGRKTAKAK